MKRALTLIALVWLIAVVAVVAAGCQQKSTGTAVNSAPMNESVVDVGMPAPGGYQPQPQVAPQPVVYDAEAAAPTYTAAPDMANPIGAGGTYTVKKGDTLYSLARQRYGDGKQWVRIAEANPGLRPETLQAGQKITIP